MGKSGNGRVRRTVSGLSSNFDVALNMTQCNLFACFMNGFTHEAGYLAGASTSQVPSNSAIGDDVDSPVEARGTNFHPVATRRTRLLNLSSRMVKLLPGAQTEFECAISGGVHELDATPILNP